MAFKVKIVRDVLDACKCATCSRSPSELACFGILVFFPDGW